MYHSGKAVAFLLNHCRGWGEPFSTIHVLSVYCVQSVRIVSLLCTVSTYCQFTVYGQYVLSVYCVQSVRIVSLLCTVSTYCQFTVYSQYVLSVYCVQSVRIVSLLCTVSTYCQFTVYGQYVLSVYCVRSVRIVSLLCTVSTYCQFTVYGQYVLSVYCVRSVRIVSLLCTVSTYCQFTVYGQYVLSVYCVRSVRIVSLLCTVSTYCQFTVRSVRIVSLLCTVSVVTYCQFTVYGQYVLSVYCVRSVRIVSLLCTYCQFTVYGQYVLSVYCVRSVRIVSLLCTVSTYCQFTVYGQYVLSVYCVRSVRIVSLLCTVSTYCQFTVYGQYVLSVYCVRSVRIVSLLCTVGTYCQFTVYSRYVLSVYCVQSVRIVSLLCTVGTYCQFTVYSRYVLSVYCVQSVRIVSLLCTVGTYCQFTVYSRYVLSVYCVQSVRIVSLLCTVGTYCQFTVYSRYVLSVYCVQSVRIVSLLCTVGTYCQFTVYSQYVLSVYCVQSVRIVSLLCTVSTYCQFTVYSQYVLSVYCVQSVRIVSLLCTVSTYCQFTVYSQYVLSVYCVQSVRIVSLLCTVSTYCQFTVYSQYVLSVYCVQSVRIVSLLCTVSTYCQFTVYSQKCLLDYFKEIIMKRHNQIPTDRGRAASRKSPGLLKMDDQIADKKTLTADSSTEMSCQSDLSSGKVFKKRMAVSPPTSSSDDKRRKTSNEIYSSVEGKNKMSKKVKDANQRALDLSVPKARSKHISDKESKGSAEVHLGSKDSSGRRLSNPNIQKEMVKDLKEVVTAELRRLATTDGFWSSKPTSRSNSPVIMGDQGDGQGSQKSGILSLRGSRTATPDTSPSSVRVRSVIKQQKKETENDELVKLNQLLELKRLKTTDGFWSPNTIQLGPRTINSRDGSPSSASSSLERLTKNIRPQVPPDDEVKEANSSWSKNSGFDKRTRKSQLVKSSTPKENDTVREVASDQQYMNQITSPAPDSTLNDTSSVKRLGRPKKKKSLDGVVDRNVKKETTVQASPVNKQETDNFPQKQMTMKIQRPRGRPKKEQPTQCVDKTISVPVPSSNESCPEETGERIFPIEVITPLTSGISVKPKRGRPKKMNKENSLFHSIHKQAGKPRVLSFQKSINKHIFKRAPKLVAAGKVKKEQDEKPTGESVEENMASQHKGRSQKKLKPKSWFSGATKVKKNNDPISSESVGLVKKKKKKSKQIVNEIVEEQPMDLVSDAGPVSLVPTSNMSDCKKTPLVQIKKKRRKIITSSPGELSLTPTKIPPTDILITPELKRLNTTEGFWAPTPDLRLVLSMPNMRRSFVRAKTVSSVNQKNNSPVKRIVKPESSLLQHRKKKLNSLKHTLQKVRQMMKSNRGLSDAASNQIAHRCLVNNGFDQKISPEGSDTNDKATLQLEKKKGTEKQRKRNTVSILGVSSSVFIDNSLQIIQKESETMASVNKLIEETESLIREDAREAKWLNLKSARTVTDKSPCSNSDEEMQVDVDASLDTKSLIDSQSLLPDISVPHIKNSPETCEESKADVTVNLELENHTSTDIFKENNVTDNFSEYNCGQGVEDREDINAVGGETSIEKEIFTPDLSSCKSSDENIPLDIVADKQSNVLATVPSETGSTTEQCIRQNDDSTHLDSKDDSVDIDSVTKLKPPRENIFDVFSQAVNETTTSIVDIASQPTELCERKLIPQIEEVLETSNMAETAGTSSPSCCSVSTVDSKNLVTPDSLIAVQSIPVSSAVAAQVAVHEDTSLILSGDILKSTLIKSDEAFPKDTLSTNEQDRISVNSSNDGVEDNLRNALLTTEEKESSHSSIGVDIKSQTESSTKVHSENSTCLKSCDEVISKSDEPDNTVTEPTLIEPPLKLAESEMYRAIGPGAIKSLSKLSQIELMALRKAKRKKRFNLVHHRTHTSAFMKSSVDGNNLTPANRSLETGIEHCSPQTLSSDSDSVIVPNEEAAHSAPLKSPIRRVRKKKRNHWKKGVFRKSTYFAKKLQKRFQSEQSLQHASSDEMSQSPSVQSSLPEGEDIEDMKAETDQPLDETNSSKEKKVRMLKRLQTDANLANAVLNEEVLNCRFLRRSHPKEVNELEVKKDHISAGSSESMKALHVDIPDETKRKRGRPRKLSCSLPKLTPPDLTGHLTRSWRGKSPPRLSPQIDPLPYRKGSTPNTFNFDEDRCNDDADIATENVDETDLHLYLSGVSDEDQSPQKETLCSIDTLSCSAGNNVELLNFSSLPPVTESIEPMGISNFTSLSPVSKLFEPIGISQPAQQSSPKKVGRPKMKGRKGKPPGMPMTDEERRKKKSKAEDKQSKNANKYSPILDSPPLKMYQFSKPPRTARKSLKSSTIFSQPSPFSLKSPTGTSPPNTTFSLRKKSTRSPLEMLEMKRRQEEAIYDLEEERKQARRILLREKRFAKEFGDGYFEDLEVGELVIKPCSVILSDFVKKLQLDTLESFSDNSTQGDIDKNFSISPKNVGTLDDDVDDEDWCADLEDFASEAEEEEWRVNEMKEYRPYIPRLKLKRVVKKDKTVESVKKSPRSSTPKPGQEPIKIVIKAEPISDSNVKTGLDLSKMERSGFEGSFVDFLKDCQDQTNRKYATKKKSYVLKPVNETKQMACEFFSPNGSTSDSLAQSSEKSPKEYTGSETRKTASLAEEEDEDMLIVDLEEGAQEQNSLDSNKGTENSTASGIIERTGVVQQDTRLHRTISNDEMGLMFASYLDENGSSDARSMQTGLESKTLKASADLSVNDGQAKGMASSPKNKDSIDGPVQGMTSLPQNKVQGISSSPQKNDNIVLENEVTACSLVSNEESEPSKNKLQPNQIPETTTNATKKGELLNENSSTVEKSLFDSSYELPEDNTAKDFIEEGVNNSPRVAVDGNKKSLTTLSPKHSSSVENPQGEWRLKVISPTDKSPSGQYRCKRCDFTSQVKLNIESHIYSHIPGVQFRCAYCESEFSSVTATLTHLKNTHTIKETKLYISRYIKEKCFYEKDEAVLPEDPVKSGKPQAGSVVAGGQSPPLIISLVVSREMSSRGGRSSVPPRRFVCTHCGFYTNVKEDADHHKRDLHSSENSFACLLCNENIFSSEAEIKQHSASVHPNHSRSYRKLPDYYEDRDDILDKITSLLQGDKSAQEHVMVDHRQKAKDYLLFQDELKEKTTVEADSTTAVEFMEDNIIDSTPSVKPLSSTTVSSEQLRKGKDGCDNEAASDDIVSDADNTAMLTSAGGMIAQLLNDVTPEVSITSSVKQSVTSLNTAEVTMNPSTKEVEEDKSLADSECTLRAKETSCSEKVTDVSANCSNLEESTDQPMSLKIVQVVSLSEDPMAKEALDALANDAVSQITDDKAKDKTDDIERSLDAVQNVPQDLSMNKNAVSKECLIQPALVGIHASTSKMLAASALQSSSVSSGLQSLSVGSGLLSSSVRGGLPSSSMSGGLPSSSMSGGLQVTSVSVGLQASSGGLPLSYKCNACKVHTPYLLMMVKHLKAKHPNMRCFACPYCKAINSFVSQKQLRHHVRNMHPDKIGRNEIALSEEAKKFVEAMVLPTSPECIRVGNRIVLEEDIHTCTYCQLKMTSLAQVYEHLNNKHSDLFEFVCPVCQSFKSKVLQDISIHCIQSHNSPLDTDKVHVSVPKSLFHVLTCISKGGKYIEKSLSTPVDSSSKQPVSSVPSLPVEAAPSIQAPHVDWNSQAKDISQLTPSKGPVMQHLLPSVQQIPSVHQQMPHVVFSQTPLIAIPLIPTISTTSAASRPIIAFSSALFDTSSLSAPPELITSVASKPPSVLQSTSGVSSFLAPGFQQQSKSEIQGKSPTPSVKNPKSKPLPVLNVPNIKPRASPLNSAPVMAHRNIPSKLTPSPVKQVSAPAREVDNLPETDPDPDAFKIFNLRPSGPVPPPSSSPSGNPSMVFPPVSSPVSSAFIQGPIAGFPSGMVVPQSLVPYAFSHQQQMLMASRPISHMSKQMQPTATPPETPRSKTKALFMSKAQQPRDLLLKERHLEMQRQRSVHPKMPTNMPHPASTLSGPYHHHTPSSVPVPQPHAPDLASRHTEVQSSVSSGNSMVQGLPRPSKGVHKRSSSIYQCPYCPQVVPLKALEVASHIHQYHPGSQVTFKKVAQ
ncbi:hypothetical protein Btru_032083 [Bulinus truncatus]|nr:hypothetical protein Btru_032083 [Bulinus truncatus]